MGLLKPAVVLLLLPIVLYIAGHAVDGYNGRAVGKREARIVLNELRKRQVSHVLKRSTDSEKDEDTDIALAMIERELERYKDRLRSTAETGANQHEAEGGEKLIQEALKGKVDPDSDVVNLLESMYVDEGSRHNQHPEGIENVASKKGKVFGDTHDGHRLTQQQIEELNQMNGGRKKNFLKSATLWTDNIIPYTIDSSLSTDQSNVDVINKAIQQFSDYTCLKWVPYGSAEANKASYSNYVEFFSGSGCWSYIGRVFDRQQISLEDPGCVSVSTAVHEMAHAIGQEHEQSRSDRDNYVTMLWKNIEGGKTNVNMEKTDTYDYNPYDYESVLQPSLKSYSSNGLPTMEFKDRRLDFLADSATGLMFYDIQDIVDAYNCTAPCRGTDGNTPLKQCQNGGFVLHTCNCHCPDGLTGDLCQSVATDPECGPGIIDLADGESRTITSPNFDNGGPYPTGKECVWLVKVMPGKFVEMTIEEMDLSTAGSACDHWLEIQYNLIGQTGPRRCGKLGKETYATELHGNPTLMLLKFDSAFASTATAGKGFKLTVSSVGEGGITPSPATQNPPTLSPVTSFSTTPTPVTSFSTTPTPVTSFSTTPTPVTSFPTQFPTTQTSSPPVVDQELHCSFETGTSCFLNNIDDDNFDWQIRRGNTSSFETGPSSAYEGQLYSYIETSENQRISVAIFKSQNVITTQPFCLTFAYQLHFTDTSIIMVKMIFSNGYRYLFESRNDTGNHWIVKMISVPPLNGKIQFIGILGDIYRSNIAIDDVHFVSGGCNTVSTSTTPVPSILPLSCTFEVGTECFLKDAVGSDDFDWTIGETSSLETGPSKAAEGSRYAYIESSGQDPGFSASLEGIVQIPKDGNMCLSFNYHMYGQTVDSLEVLFQGLTLFHEVGNKGDQWNKAALTLFKVDSTVAPKIQFRATRGSSYEGDIAIDNIQFTEGKCVGLLASCTFDDGSCFLTNINGQDTMDWLITEKRTPSLNTGPSKPLDGNYTFIEASGRTAGDNAILSSAATSHFSLSGPACLRFFYNMNGRYMGTLNVIAGERNSEQNVWNISGNQNDNWTPVAVDIPPANNFVIMIEAIRGSSYLGDIAIDTIELFGSPCFASLSILPQRCTFEDGTDCFLKDDKKYDDFDWKVKYGRTLSRNTGPSMAAEGRNYAYIEASGKQPGVRATLERLVSVPADGKMCLSFEYHMFGRTMGSLEVLFQNTTIFHEFGDRGNIWNKAEFNLNGLNSSAVPVLQFTATRGSGFQSDVAIDNVQLEEGECAVPLPT